MKDKFIRELTPYVAIGMLVSGSLIAPRASVTGDASVSKTSILFPKSIVNTEIKYDELNKNDSTILLMDSQNEKTDSKYTYLKAEDIDRIDYKEDGLSVVIYLLNSDIYYVGHYNEDVNKYIYTIKSNQLVKK